MVGMVARFLAVKVKDLKDKNCDFAQASGCGALYVRW